MIDISADIARATDGLRLSERRALAAQAAAVRTFGDAYRDELLRQTPRGQGEANGRQRLIELYEVSSGAAGLRAEYRIVNRAPWLTYVRRGRGPVVATRAKALRFVIRGVVYFRKRVGPAKANDYPARVAGVMAARRADLVSDAARGVAAAMRGR